MVSPELDREYARRGVGLVHPDDGVARLLDELRTALPEPEIVLARARVSTFEAPSVSNAGDHQSVSNRERQPVSPDEAHSVSADEPQSVSAGEP
jgi:hypothetical protein